ncbi:tail protein X [Roseibium alexandrii]
MKLILLAAVALLTQFSTASAQNIACDTYYTTQTGDNLSRIAGQAYGRTTAYQPIFDYNPNVLKSPSVLPVGVDLYIPCLDKNGPQTPLPAVAASSSDDIKILTGADYAPYVDTGLPQGGFSFELIERALQFGTGAADYRIDVIKDWDAHLVPLLSEGAYDLAFPWFQPDCSDLSKLGEGSVWRCKNLRFSEPLHDVVVSFYAKTDTAAAISSPGDVHGMTICRPSGYFTHDLESMGLVPPVIIRVAGKSPADCFERLKAGSVDIATVNADTSDRMITELGIEDDVSEIIELATIQTLHIVAMKRNPDSRVNLLRINKGLKGLQKDGSFQKIAGNHL